MKRKAQAAMEYLMTYGWAILIVIIVAAALYALGVFNPATWTGDRATGFTNLGAPASGAWLVTDTMGAPGNLQVKLSNNRPSRINITSATNVKVGASDCSDEAVKVGTGSVVPLATAESTVGIGNEFTLYANCSGLTDGSSYTANIEIVYDNIDTGLDGFRESGTLTGTVS
jgi:hypothetical protein